MRLIDAENIGDFIVEHAEQIQYAIEHKDMELLEPLINQIPTAYDVDKVVEEIESCFNATEDKGRRLAYHRAITIVKGGGMND